MRPLYIAQPTSNPLQNLFSTNKSVCCTDIRNCYKNRFSKKTEKQQNMILRHCFNLRKTDSLRKLKDKFKF